MTTKITEKNISNLANAGVQWQSVQTSGFTAIAGEGYFCDTTSAAFTVTLPASATRGDTIVLKDYAGTFATNNITLGLNGHKIDGQSFANAFSTNHSIIQLIYSDVTKGWRSMQNVSVTDIGLSPAYVSATGGTVTTSGNFKIHTFTGDGSFVVATAGNIAGSNTVSYLVVAGGAGTYSGGGGAGGFREGKATSDCYSASPLNNPGGLPVSVTTYPITVGAGGSPGTGHPGAGIPFPPSSYSGATSGSNSIFSTITSAGGGRGGSQYNQATSGAVGGATGGSGGGGGTGTCGPTGISGAGNTPPVSPPQGNSGGTAGYKSAGGGGGATSVGSNGGCLGAPTQSGGGSGATTSISGSPTTYAGGGGGGSRGNTPVSPGFVGVTAGTGGSGGGGSGGASPSGSGTAGSANTGGGGGGAGSLDAHFGSAHSPGGFAAGSGGSGGKGIVIIRYKYQ